ncbi:MAG TPA: DinB family protein [Candidatus Nanopelagicales bacterium]|jgi:uncharacterized damage-inducible protein DinB
MTTAPTTGTTDQERTELLGTLARHRYFLRFTVAGLTDEQAATRTTVSALTLSGLIKHVADMEQSWVDFIEQGAAAFEAAAAEWSSDPAEQDWGARFRLAPGQTLAGILEEYEQVARRTEQVIRDLPDLDADHPLPEAPWFEPGAHWSARRVMLHLLAETSQHAGHADIIRESLDGQKTMG